MKSTNVRELMNILSDKYFGHDLHYTSNKSMKTQIKSIPKTEQSNYSILSPNISAKLSPKYNRTSSLSQMKKNQNINYFQESRNILQETKNMLNKPVNTFNKNDKKRLQIRESSDFEIGSDKKINNEGYQYTYTRKYSQKDLNNKNQIDLSSLLTPAGLGANRSSKDLKANDKIANNFSKNSNSRLVKQRVTDKAINEKRLFLRETDSNKMESHSTISNSRSSKYIEETVEQKQFLNQQQTYLNRKQKQQLNFYKQKCLTLEQQNSGLKQKISLYEQQFIEEKQMVENLKNMINQREQEINEIINNKLSEFNEKEQILQNTQAQNENLKSQLNNVRQLLREQQAIIIELYAKNKNKPLVTNETPQIYQGVENKYKFYNNGKNTLTSLTSHCSSSSRKNNESPPYIPSYIDSNARESIEESSFENQ